MSGEVIRRENKAESQFFWKNQVVGISIIQITVPTANTAATAAAIIRIRSSELIVGAAAGATRRACGAAGAAARDGVVTGAAVARGTACVGAEADGMAPLDAPVGPPGGSVGNLIVGAVDGLGGKLMRTVSFLG